MKQFTTALLAVLTIFLLITFINRGVRDKIGGAIGITAVVMLIGAVAFLHPDLNRRIMSPLHKYRKSKMEESQRIYAERAQQWRERERQGQERAAEENRARLALLEQQRRQEAETLNPQHGHLIRPNPEPTTQNGRPASQTETTSTNGEKPI